MNCDVSAVNQLRTSDIEPETDPRHRTPGTGHRLTAYSLCLLALVFASCKTQEVVTGEVRKMKPKELVKAVEANGFDAEYMTGAAKVTFTDSSGLPSVKMAIRAKRDSVIWLSVSKLIQVGKAIITPDSIKGISSLDRTYLVEPYGYIEKSYGIAADFGTLQRLLFAGLPITDHRTLEADVVDKAHVLRGQLNGISYEVFIEPVKYQITRVVMTEENSSRRLDVEYSDYKDTDGGPFPHIIRIAASGDMVFGAELSLSNIKKEKALEFPFQIPAGYTRI